jgi:hypothetical protein
MRAKVRSKQLMGAKSVRSKWDFAQIKSKVMPQAKPPHISDPTSKYGAIVAHAVLKLFQCNNQFRAIGCSSCEAASMLARA